MQKNDILGDPVLTEVQKHVSRTELCIYIY